MTPAAWAALYRAQLARAERLLVRHQDTMNEAGVALLQSVVALRRRDLLALGLEV